MIRIKELDGTVVETTRHTYEQATAARDANIGILVGGTADTPDLDVDIEDGDTVEVPRPERTIYPQGIASIEDVPA